MTKSGPFKCNHSMCLTGSCEYDSRRMVRHDVVCESCERLQLTYLSEYNQCRFLPSACAVTKTYHSETNYRTKKNQRKSDCRRKRSRLLGRISFTYCLKPGTRSAYRLKHLNETYKDFLRSSIRSSRGGFSKHIAALPRTRDG